MQHNVPCVLLYTYYRKYEIMEHEPRASSHPNIAEMHFLQNNYKRKRKLQVIETRCSYMCPHLTFICCSCSQRANKELVTALRHRKLGILVRGWLTDIYEWGSYVDAVRWMWAIEIEIICLCINSIYMNPPKTWDPIKQ